MNYDEYMMDMMNYMYQWMMGWGILGFIIEALTIIVLVLLIVVLIKHIKK